MPFFRIGIKIRTWIRIWIRGERRWEKSDYIQSNPIQSYTCNLSPSCIHSFLLPFTTVPTLILSPFQPSYSSRAPNSSTSDLCCAYVRTYASKSPRTYFSFAHGGRESTLLMVLRVMGMRLVNSILLALTVAYARWCRVFGSVALWELCVCTVWGREDGWSIEKQFLLVRVDMMKGIM